MLILNADDLGGWPEATDAIVHTWRKGQLSSVSAMVFMKDTLRAADLSGEFKMDIGLHLNFDQVFSGPGVSNRLAGTQYRLQAFAQKSKYSVLVINPFLMEDFRLSVHAQFDEFRRVFKREPSHVNGHHHRHLTANVIFQKLIPSGTVVRRNFSFQKGEKSLWNLIYRRFLDGILEKRYIMTDYLFALSDCVAHPVRWQVINELASARNVELLTHPQHLKERAFLDSVELPRLGSFSSLAKKREQVTT